MLVLFGHTHSAFESGNLVNFAIFVVGVWLSCTTPNCPFQPCDCSLPMASLDSWVVPEGNRDVGLGPALQAALSALDDGNTHAGSSTEYYSFQCRLHFSIVNENAYSHGLL